MEWRPITIETSGKLPPVNEDEKSTMGLTASPEKLHQEFLADLGHLQEIHNSHIAAISENFNSVEANFDKTAGVISTTAMLNRFDGVQDESHIALPLHGCELSGVELSMTEIDGSSIVKLNVTSRAGDEIEQAFNLPQGRRLASASWDGGSLHLHLA